MLAFLDHLEVHPNRRGRGIGGSILDAVVTKLRDDGIRVIESRYPASSEPARRLFQRRRFREVGFESGPAETTEDLTSVRVERVFQRPWRHDA